MNKAQSHKNQLQTVSEQNHLKGLNQLEQVFPDEIYEVVDKQIVPTRAPSEVEQDISPGTPTQQM